MVVTKRCFLFTFKQVRPWITMRSLKTKPLNKAGLEDGGAYYNEFMKLLKRQKEPPFLYTSISNCDDESVDLTSLGKLARTVKAQEKLAGQSMFSQLGVSRPHQQLLKKYGISEPLKVQKASLVHLFQRRSAIIESETGSGKTLTYLLPVLQDLGNRSCSNIIIVPTRELASQVYKEALKYVPDRRQVVRYVSGIDDNQERKLDRALRESQIVIATPKRLIEIFEQKNGHFRNIRRIVLDEVDKLLPARSMFKGNMNKTKPAERLLAMLVYQNKHAQLIATSATVSDFLIQELQDRGFTKRCQVIKCSPQDYRHGKVPANIKHFFTVAKRRTDSEVQEEIGDKVKCIAQLFRQSNHPSTLVFLPKHMSVQSVVSAFQDMHIPAVAMYKKLLLPSPREFEKFVRAFEEGDIEIVVSTEETVRGMDFPFINRAYLTYVPTTPEDYVHVAGRVGRANRPGEIITVLSEADEKNERRQLKRRFASLKIKGRRIIT